MGETKGLQTSQVTPKYFNLELYYLYDLMKFQRSRLLERKESELTLEGINSNAFDQDVFLNDHSKITTLDRVNL